MDPQTPQEDQTPQENTGMADNMPAPEPQETPGSDSTDVPSIPTEAPAEDQEGTGEAAEASEELETLAPVGEVSGGVVEGSDSVSPVSTESSAPEAPSEEPQN